MLKFLNLLLASLGFSNKKIPSIVEHHEKICRTVYSPFNLKGKNSSTLDPNLFKTPYDIDEVSVNRLDYTNANFCKKLSKKNENPTARKNYYGFAILNQEEILSCDCETVYSPIKKPRSKKNIFHSDLKVGYTPIKGVPWPTHITKKITDLTKKARCYPDPDITSAKWNGGTLV